MSKTPKTLTTIEQHQLLAALIPKVATHEQHAKGVRNYCMAILMLDAGLRVGEVVKLLQTDLLLNSQPVNALYLAAQITKTHTERTVPLSTRIQRAIEEVRRNCWIYCPVGRTHYAFYNKYADTHVSTRQVQRIIESASENSIGRAIHPHVLRHTFGSKMMRVTNARIVQQLLGHKNLTTTQVYTHPNQDDLSKAIEKLNDK